MGLLLALALLLGAPSSPPDRVGTALDVLHAWDARRQAAWAAGDARALRGLYVAGSPASRADVRLLRAYANHDLVVHRIDTQVFAVEVRARDSGRLVLRVLDRVAGGVVAGPEGTTPLRPSSPRRRTVELVRRDGAWLVARVSASG